MNDSLIRPLTAITFAAETAGAVRIGRTTLAIRPGLRDYVVGDTLVIAFEDTGLFAMSEVTSVNRAPLRNLTKDDLIAGGLPDDLEAAVAFLEQFYPGVNADTKVTVFGFIPVNAPDQPVVDGATDVAAKTV